MLRRRARAQPNPAWTTRALALDWAAMQAEVGPTLMPELDVAGAARGKMTVRLEELGCGAYGCVLPTNDPAVVLKVTTDATEVEFARTVMPRLSATARDGFVRYIAAMDLDARHEGRPVFALWRVAAEHVGKLDQVFEGAELRDLESVVAREWSAASVALQALIEAGDGASAIYREASGLPARPLEGAPETMKRALERISSPPARLRAALDSYDRACERMLGGPLERVGRGLRACLRESVFVADVHKGNVGMSPGRDGAVAWVITDPGNAIVLPRPWR